MEKIDFEFTSQIFNENEFLSCFQSLLFTLTGGDNFLLNELMFSGHLEYPKHCIKHNMYLIELEDHIKRGIQKDFKIIEAKLTDLIMNNSKSKDQYINLIIRKTNFFIDQYNQLEYLEKFNYILKTITSQLNHFINQYSSRTGQLSSDLPHSKITWNGGVGALGTLFSELRFKYANDNNKPLIEGNVVDIVRFVHNSFVDPLGEPFEEQSLRKYIYENSKSAKNNRVELETIFRIPKSK